MPIFKGKVKEMNGANNALERLYSQFDAMIDELVSRRDEIVGGKLTGLCGMEIELVITPTDDPEIKVTRHIIAYGKEK